MALYLSETVQLSFDLPGIGSRHGRVVLPIWNPPWSPILSVVFSIVIIFGVRVGTSHVFNKHENFKLNLTPLLCYGIPSMAPLVCTTLYLQLYSMFVPIVYTASMHHQYLYTLYAHMLTFTRCCTQCVPLTEIEITRVSDIVHIIQSATNFDQRQRTHFADPSNPPVRVIKHLKRELRPPRK